MNFLRYFFRNLGVSFGCTIALTAIALAAAAILDFASPLIQCFNEWVNEGHIVWVSRADLPDYVFKIQASFYRLFGAIAFFFGLVVSLVFMCLPSNYRDK